MAHFAQLDDDNKVIGVVVVANAALDPSNEEASGIAFLATLGNGRYVQTSYNNNFRKQYAGIGFTYDETADEFVRQQTHASWFLDSNNDWQPPTPSPKPESDFYWNEESLSWLAIPVG